MTTRQSRIQAKRRALSNAQYMPLQPLEPRTLLSAAPFALPLHSQHAILQPAIQTETASAQLNLLSTTGTPSSPIYNYDITLTDTGNTNLGSFWFSWIPGDDFLPNIPLSTGHPANWTPTVTGSHTSLDGSAIEWVAQSSAAALTPGNSLSGFTFSSPDSPDVLAGSSPTHPGNPVLTAFVYIGQPLLDAGFKLTVAGVPASTSNSPTTTTTLAASSLSASAGDPVIFTATVTPTSAGAAPTGTVNFVNPSNNQVLGTADVQPDGTATFTTSSLPQGTDFINAIYSGDNTYATSTSNPFTESIGPAPHFVFTTLPPTAIAGHASTFAVSIEDSSGHVDTSNNSTITLSIGNGSPTNSTLTGTASIAAVNGVATFADLSLNIVGTYTLAAANGVLASAASNKFTITADSASAQLVLVQQPSAALVGKPLNAITVKVEDQFGNLLSANHSTGTLTIGNGPTGSTLTGTAHATANKGVLTFKNLSLNTAGSYTLQIADGVLTPLMFSQTITPGTSSLAAPHVPAAIFGQTIKFQAMLKSTAPANIHFTGTVSLLDQNNAVLGTAAVAANGALKFSLTNIPPGTHTCTLSYPGDANHTAITSAAFTLQINPSRQSH